MLHTNDQIPAKTTTTLDASQESAKKYDPTHSLRSSLSSLNQADLEKGLASLAISRSSTAYGLENNSDNTLGTTHKPREDHNPSRTTQDIDAPFHVRTASWLNQSDGEASWQ